MKIALVKTPLTYADYNKRPILGIGYISACLRSRDIDCRIFDADFNAWSREKTIDSVLEYGPDIVGFTAMTHEIVANSQIALQLRERLNAPIIIGGCHVTALPQETLEEFPAFDYAVYGEGEKTMLELIEFLQQSDTAEPLDIPSLAFL